MGQFENLLRELMDDLPDELVKKGEFLIDNFFEKFDGRFSQGVNLVEEKAYKFLSAGFDRTNEIIDNTINKFSTTIDEKIYLFERIVDRVLKLSFDKIDEIIDALNEGFELIELFLNEIKQMEKELIVVIDRSLDRLECASYSLTTNLELLITQSFRYLKEGNHYCEEKYKFFPTRTVISSFSNLKRFYEVERCLLVEERFLDSTDDKFDVYIHDASLQYSLLLERIKNYKCMVKSSYLKRYFQNEEDKANTIIEILHPFIRDNFTENRSNEETCIYVDNPIERISSWVNNGGLEKTLNILDSVKIVAQGFFVLLLLCFFAAIIYLIYKLVYYIHSKKDKIKNCRKKGLKTEDIELRIFENRSELDEDESKEEMD